MQVSIQTTDNAFTHEMDVSVPSSGVLAQIEGELTQLQKGMRLDGFRPGKVPMALVRKQHEPSLRHDVISRQAFDRFYRIAQEQSISVVGVLSLETAELDADDTLTFKIHYETYPEITLPDFATLSIEKTTVAITDDDVDQMIEKLRTMRKEFTKVDEPAGMDYLVNVDFEGVLNGVAFEGGTAQDIPLVLGSGRMIPGFEEGIEGMSVGETKTIPVTFPAEYQAKDLAGKAVEFKITVNSVQRPKLPEVDADFIAEFGIKSGDLDEFKINVRENLERQVDLTLMKVNREAVLEALNTSLDGVMVPKTMIAQQVEEILTERKVKLPTPAEIVEISNDLAQRIPLGMLFSAIVKTHNLQASEDRVKQLLSLEAHQYDDADQFISWYLSDAERRRQVEAVALEHEVVDFVLSKAQVTEKLIDLTSLTA